MVGARDSQGRPFASLLTGAPGFVHSPVPSELHIEARPTPDDALGESLSPGDDLAVLGIDFATRRRNRAAGLLRASAGDTLHMHVNQAYGNCPKFITPRRYEIRPRSAPPETQRSKSLSRQLQQWLERTDTVFIATGHGSASEGRSRGLDVSHRGGEPGFVHVLSDDTLLFPDYRGNNLFNTVGNLLLEPAAGLLLVDFKTGALLQLTGTAQIDWDSGRLAEHPGAQRLVEFRLEEAVHRTNAIPLRWYQP